MSGVSVPSPAILKKNTGAANVGTAGGNTVQQWVTAFDVAMGNVEGDVSGLQSFVGGLMPKSGGTFTGDVIVAAGLGYRASLKSGGSRDLIKVSSSSDNTIIGSYLSDCDLELYTGVGRLIKFYIDNNNNVFSLSGSGIRLGNSGSRCNTILDQDNFSSNSATALATQQSIKAYVDNSVAAVPSPGIVLISSADITTPVAAIDLVLGGYDEYIIRVIGLVPEQERQLLVRTSSDGGATFDDGASDYSVDSVSVNGGSSSVPFTEVVDPGIDVSKGGVSGLLRVFGASSAAYTLMKSSAVFYGGNSNRASGSEVVSIRQSVAVVDAVRLYFLAGNVASGKVAIYGVNR